MRKFLTFLWVLSGFWALSQSYTPPPAPLVEVDSIIYAKKGLLPARVLLKEDYQTNNPTFARNIKKDFRQKYQGRDFDYSEAPPQESFLQKLKRKIYRFLSSIFDNGSYRDANAITVNVLKILGIAVVGYALYFFISFLIKKEGGWLFGKKNKSVRIRNEELHENIHDMNFPELILQAERSGDFRLAIRYQFLLILKKLADQDAISWHPEKTNQDYIAEMKDETMKKNFRRLTRIFEYVWYGEFPLGAEDYGMYISHFRNFKV